MIWFKRNYVLVIFSIFFVSLLIFIDIVNGREIRISYLYFIPIIICSWFLGSRGGLLIAVLSAGGWIFIDFYHDYHYSSEYIRLWKIFIRLLFFIFVAYSASKFAFYVKRQRMLTEYIIHDLKTPIANIQLSLDNLKNSMSNFSENIKRYIITAQISTKRLLSLINSILDLFRLDDGKYELNVDEYSIMQIVDVATEEVSAWAEKNKVTIKVDMKCENILLKTDYWLLIRILINLLSNSIKASLEGSVIVLRISERVKDANKIIFYISDEGLHHKVDILKTKGLKALFEDRVYSGNNLGLLFCNHASKALKGEFKIDGLQEGKMISSVIIPKCVHSS